MTRRTRLNEPTELSCALLQVGVNVTALHDCLEAYSSAVGSDPASANAALTAVRGERAAIEPSLVNLAKAVRTARQTPLLEAGRIQAVVNELQLAHGLWPDGDGEAAALAQNGTALRGHLRESALKAAQLTVADQLAAELLRLKPGQFIDLGAFLRGQVPAETLEDLVAWLGQHGNSLINGVVDVRRNRVYRLPVSSLGRFWRYPGAPIASVLASVAVLGVAAWLANKAGDDSRSQLGPWLLAYAAVLLGVAIHFGVALAKRRTAADTGDAPKVATEVPVVSKWWQWLMLRPLAAPSILLSPLITVIILRLLAYPVDLGKPKELTTYVLAGFSADSIAGAASKRVNDLAGAVQKGVIGKLG
jgi:hypothetical protein